MDELRDALQSNEEGDSLLALLEKLSEDVASRLAYSFLSVLLEDRSARQSEEPQNGTNESFKESDAVAQIEAVSLSEPRGVFDVAFHETGFVLKPHYYPKDWILIPYSVVETVARIEVTPEDIQRVTGIDEIGANDLGDSSKPNELLFISLCQDAAIEHKGEALQTVTIKSRDETSVELNAATSETGITGSVVHVFSELLRLRDVLSDKYDVISADRPQNGARFFTPVLGKRAGFLFLMERSLCFAGDGCLCLPHHGIAAMGIEVSKGSHFTLVLSTKIDRTLYRLRHLSIADRGTLLQYFSKKRVKICAVEDLDLAQSIAQPETTEEGGLDYLNSPRAGQSSEGQSESTESSEGPEGSPPDSGEDNEETDEEEDRMDDSEADMDTNETSEEGDPVTSSPPSADLLHMLGSQDLPENDAEDNDYLPSEDMDYAWTERRQTRSSGDDSGSQGCLIRKRCPTDDDMELEEIDSEHS